MEKNVLTRVRFFQLALSIGAIKLSHTGWTLGNGRVTPYLFDAGRFDTGQLYAHLVDACTGALLDAVSHGMPMPDVIFSAAGKGVPLAVALSMYASALGDEYINNGWAYNLEKGEGAALVGSGLPGKRVLIVDYEIGASTGEAADIIRAELGKPIGCIIPFDRQERGVGEKELSVAQAFTRDYGVPVYAVMTLSGFLKSCRFLGSILGEIAAYHQMYGAK